MGGEHVRLPTLRRPHTAYPPVSLLGASGTPLPPEEAAPGVGSCRVGVPGVVAVAPLPRRCAYCYYALAGAFGREGNRELTPLARQGWDDV